MKSGQEVALIMKTWNPVDPRKELLERGHSKIGSGGQRPGCLRSRMWELGIVEECQGLGNGHGLED